LRFKSREMLAVDIEKIPFYQEGIEKGIEKGIRIVAIQMLKLDFEIETIQKTTGLSIKEIEEIKKELT